MVSKRKISYRAGSTPDVAMVGVHSTSTGFTKLDEATASYFTDLIGHLSHITHGEERALLAANALEEAEASGKFPPLIGFCFTRQYNTVQYSLILTFQSETASHSLLLPIGKALAVATDRMCSRPIEAIIDAAPPKAICSFARCLLSPKSQFQELSVRYAFVTVEPMVDVF